VNQFLDIDARCFAAHTPEPMSWAGFAELLSHHWGNVASVLGLVVSVATLAVATKAREAAEAARAVARRQSLAEALQDSVRKSEQVGLFLTQQKWDIVWLRAQEVAAATGVVLGDLSGSISEAVLVSSGRPPTAEQVARMSQAQGRVAQLLNTELGGALRGAEGSR
jgi:hypothetical protein